MESHYKQNGLHGGQPSLYTAFINRRCTESTLGLRKLLDAPQRIYKFNATLIFYIYFGVLLWILF